MCVVWVHVSCFMYVAQCPVGCGPKGFMGGMLFSCCLVMSILCGLRPLRFYGWHFVSFFLVMSCHACSTLWTHIDRNLVRAEGLVTDLRDNTSAEDLHGSLADQKGHHSKRRRDLQTIMLWAYEPSLSLRSCVWFRPGGMLRMHAQAGLVCVDWGWACAANRPLQQ